VRPSRRNLLAWLSSGIVTLFQVADANQPLLLGEVLEVSREHSPRILESVEKLRAREGKLLESQGVFDLEIQQESRLRAAGFHDGRTVDTRLVKPLPDFAARLSTGYRVTLGEVPAYERRLLTDDRGEFNFGLVFSLLRDRAIDERRFAVAQGELNVSSAELEVLVSQISVQQQAVNAYYGWVAAGLKRRIFAALVDIALQRESALEKRVREGDLAAIFITENRQAVLRRQVLLNEAEREFANAAVQLSLFYRDPHGRPQLPPAERLPESFPPIETRVLDELHGALAAARAGRPEFAIVDNATAIERQRLAVGKNRLLPRVDVELRTAQDVGSGPIEREDADLIFGVQVAIPLETRLGRGAVAEARANLAQLAYQRQQLEEQLVAEIQQIGNDLEAARNFALLTAQEVEQASLMEIAERERFEAGAADFFLVNIREERTADAGVRNVDAELDWFRRLASYQATTVDREALGLAGTR
jgi:outer membrane protein TolC